MLGADHELHRAARQVEQLAEDLAVDGEQPVLGEGVVVEPDGIEHRLAVRAVAERVEGRGRVGGIDGRFKAVAADVVALEVHAVLRGVERGGLPTPAAVADLALEAAGEAEDVVVVGVDARPEFDRPIRHRGDGDAERVVGVVRRDHDAVRAGDGRLVREHDGRRRQLVVAVGLRVERVGEELQVLAEQGMFRVAEDAVTLGITDGRGVQREREPVGRARVGGVVREALGRGARRAAIDQSAGRDDVGGIRRRGGAHAAGVAGARRVVRVREVRQRTVAVAAVQRVGAVVGAADEHGGLLGRGTEDEAVALFRGVGRGGVAVGRIELGAIEVLLQDDVHHAGDRIGAVQGGTAVLEHLDPVHRPERDGVEVLVRRAPPVDEHQRAARDAAQRDRRGPVAAVALREAVVAAADRRGRLAEDLVDGAGTAALDGLRGDDVDRSGGDRLRRRDQRSGDDLFLHLRRGGARRGLREERGRGDELGP